MAELEQLTKQYNRVLEDYQNTYNEFIKSLSSGYVDSGKKYVSDLENLNQRLMDINQEIISKLKHDYTKYTTDYAKQQTQTEFVENNYSNLKEERNQINRLLKENVTLNQASLNSELIVTQFYTYYVGLLLLTLMLGGIIIKYKGSRSTLVGGFFKK
jgi:predicted nuclease with TOPRIM domain